MLFNEFLTGLSQQGGSVRAYDKCAREARARIAAEPENAAALLLIAYAAQHFVDAYDDQPLTVEMAAKEFDYFSEIVGALDKGYSAGSAEARVTALNKVAAMLASGLPL
jgi:hypothetical protein